MIEKPRSRTRSGVWLLVSLILVAGFFTSCVSSDVRHGVFTFRMEDGATDMGRRTGRDSGVVANRRHGRLG